MTSISSLTDNAADEVIARQGIARRPSESPLTALGFALGESITHEEGMQRLIESAVMRLDSASLIRIQAELRSRYDAGD